MNEISVYPMHIETFLSFLEAYAPKCTHVQAHMATNCSNDELIQL